MKMVTSRIVLTLVLALWVEACTSDNTRTEPGTSSGADASAPQSAPQITGCNTFSASDCAYTDVGCALGVSALDIQLEDSANVCSIIVHVECGDDNCVSSVREIDSLPSPPMDDAGVTPIPVDDGDLGGPCEMDSDCGGSLICLTAMGTDWVGGGPSSGYCTLPCASDATVCSAFPGAACVTGLTADEAYCFEGCTKGESTSATKCHSRADVACLQVSSTSTACLPTCGSDGECPVGRYCDLFLGVCVDQEPAGDPLGMPCDPNAAVDPCAGFCVDFGNGYAVCSGLCTVGLGIPSCGFDADTPGSPICLPLLGETDSVGDGGLCLQQCDCNDECLSSLAVCESWDDTELQATLGAQGLCSPPSGDGGAAGLVCSSDQDGGMTTPIADAGDGG